MNASEISVVFSHLGISSWIGQNATKELRAMAIKCVLDARDIISLNSGNGPIPIFTYEQGEAPPDFWKLLQIPMEPPEIPNFSVRFNDPILQCLNGPTAPLDLSSTTSNCINIAVVGGGAAGVFCARQMLAPLYKQYLNITITLFEKSDTIGGMAAKPGDFEAGCPFFTARSAEFKEFTRRSFLSGHVQPLEMNIGVGEAQDNAFRTFRFAAPSFESAEDQDYIYKHSANPKFFHPKSTVPFFYPDLFLPPANCFSQIRTDAEPRTKDQKSAPKPTVTQPDFLFHEAHSLSQTMSAGNLWTGRLWRGHPSMADWFTSLLNDPRINIKLGTEVTEIERLQKRGGGTKLYGFTKDNKTLSFLGNFDYVSICTEFNISIKLTKNISKMMHLALAHSYQNDLDPAHACDSYHHEAVVEFNPPLATALDMMWLESKNLQDAKQIGLAFALKDASRHRLFTTGVDRLRGHSDRVVSMAKGYSYSTLQSHPVGGGHSTVVEGQALRDVWVLYSERGWNCMGPIGFHFMETLKNFMSTLQKSVSDEQQAVKRCVFFVKQCQSQLARWQMLVEENDVRTSDFKHKAQQENEEYELKLETLILMKNSAEILRTELQEHLQTSASNLQSSETSKQNFEQSLPKMEKEVIAIDTEIFTVENDLKVTQDSAARCRLDVLAQEDKISAATQLFDRDVIIDAAIESHHLSPIVSDVPDPMVTKNQREDWVQNAAVVSLVRLDSNVSLQDGSFRNEEIAADDTDYLMHKSAKEARTELHKNHVRREKEGLMQEELSRLLVLSQAAEHVVAAQTSKMLMLQALLASNISKIEDMRKELQSLNIHIENLRMRNEDIIGRLDKAVQRLEFLTADEIVLQVEIMQHKQQCASHILNLQSEREVLQKMLVVAQKKHDLWIHQREKATCSLGLLDEYLHRTVDAMTVFESELKIHSAKTVKQLCKNTIQVCEQSNFANLRDCDGDTVVHFFGQRYIGLNSAELRRSKTKLLQYLANFGAEVLLIPSEESIEVLPPSTTTEPEFVQRLWDDFLNLKTKYADYVLANLVNDQEETISSDGSELNEESSNKFILVSGDKIQIDPNSDDFSPLSLLRLAAKLCKTCNLNSKQVVMEMLASDFDQMFAVIRKYFHAFVSIISEEEELPDDDEEYQDTNNSDDDEEESIEFDQPQNDEIGDCAEGFLDNVQDGSAGFFRDSDDDSDFMDELSVDRQRRRNKMMREVLKSSVIKNSAKKRQESTATQNRQSAASLCFDGSSLFDFHTKVCVCGNWLIDSSIEGAFLSGSSGAHRLMQSIEDDPVMLARLGEDALVNTLYSDDLQLRAQMQRNMEKQITLRRMTQRSNLRPEQCLRQNFVNWQRMTLKGRLLSDLLKRIKRQFYSSCLTCAFNYWAEATDEQWALQFAAILQWTRTLKSRAFVHWRVISDKKASAGSYQKTLSCLFGPGGNESEENQDVDSEAVNGHELHELHTSTESEIDIVQKNHVPLHTDLSNIHNWCRCPLPPFSWSSEDEQCLKLPDISGSTDADLAKLAKQFLKDKPTKQSEYIFRLGWLLFWYRDNNEFAPKSLAAKMASWEEKYLGLSPDVSGQVLPRCNSDLCDASTISPQI